MALSVCLSATMAYALEAHDQPAFLSKVPEVNDGFCWIDGIETHGVTFVMEGIQLEGRTLTMKVLRLPNDKETSLMDNQVDYPLGNESLARELEEASQYGKIVLGTLCDLRAVTDENGSKLLRDYRVATERKGAALVDVFCAEMPITAETKQLRIELVFGVNEDLSARFQRLDSYVVNLTLQN